MPAARADDDPAELLRAHGLRATRGSLAVFDCLRGSDGALTPDEVFEGCRASGADGIDRVTVYRALDRLAQAGLCDKVIGADRTGRYLARGTAVGPLFECASCHRIVPIADDRATRSALRQLERQLERQGLQAPDAALMIRGTCTDCRS
ncbi:Fur family transcriptional regulator [Derxia lacustris]|uniref:Fur family transcriptional regulator n=1 Tax=Derxia lacustris TaxID=764842 RepID=UPI00159318DF|nr:transcriptional repressor [Derxia lacustris]